MIKRLLFFITILIFIGCGNGKNTTSAIVKDIKSIAINKPLVDSILSTSDGYQFQATIYYNDGSESNGTKNVAWRVDDYDISTMYIGFVKPKANTGDINITIFYKDFSDEYRGKFHIIKATGIDILNYEDINTTGEFTLTAQATYENNLTKNIDTGNSQNITWYVDGDASLVEIIDGKAKINFYAGETNITASLFNEINKTITIKID
jgi:hypothetical protein